MRYALSVLCILACAASFGEALPVLTDLEDLRWQHRILVINEPDLPEELIGRLQDNAAAFDERRLAWFLIWGKELRTNYLEPMAHDLRKNILAGLSPKSNEVILIGLDGGVKARGEEIDLEFLYTTIDAMPMRRSELRR